VVSRQNPPFLIEIPSFPGERSAAVERFERRAEEIARAAEVRESPAVEEPADLLTPLRQHRGPEVGDERRLAGRDARQDPRRQDADTGVEKRFASFDPEAGDSVPFGLKRRVPVRLSVLHDEECRRSAGLAVPGEERRDVRLDDGVGIHDQEVPVREPAGGVLQGAGRAEDLRLREEAQVREIRRAIAQMAFDLFAKMMKIDARFKDAVAPEPLEAGPDQRDVQERKEGLGN